MRCIFDASNVYLNRSWSFESHTRNIYLSSRVSFILSFALVW